MTTYTMIPGIAAYLAVRVDGAPPLSAIFLGHEKGVLVGLHDKKMADYGWPQQVQDSITKHFAHVFSLEHETWRDYPNPSPRAVYCDAAQPWTIEVPE